MNARKPTLRRGKWRGGAKGEKGKGEEIMQTRQHRGKEEGGKDGAHGIF